MPLNLYKKHTIIRYIINFTAGFLLFSTLPFIFAFYIDNVYDRFDNHQYLSIEIKESNYIYKKCQDIRLDLRVNAEVPLTINKEYRASLVDDSKTIAVAGIYPERYTRIKRDLPQPVGSTDYTAIAFTSSQTCQWDAGTYRIVLFYNYVYRSTTRSYSVATVLTVTD